MDQMCIANSMCWCRRSVDADLGGRVWGHGKATCDDVWAPERDPLPEDGMLIDGDSFSAM